jgi:hypothetical protein
MLDGKRKAQLVRCHPCRPVPTSLPPTCVRCETIHSSTGEPISIARTRAPPGAYRGTLSIKSSPLLGPCSRALPRALRCSLGGGSYGVFKGGPDCKRKALLVRASAVPTSTWSSGFRLLGFGPYTLHPAPFTRHPTPYTLHSTLLNMLATWTLPLRWQLVRTFFSRILTLHPRLSTVHRAL